MRNAENSRELPLEAHSKVGNEQTLMRSIGLRQNAIHIAVCKAVPKAIPKEIHNTLSIEQLLGCYGEPDKVLPVFIERLLLFWFSFIERKRFDWNYSYDHKWFPNIFQLASISLPPNRPLMSCARLIFWMSSNCLSILCLFDRSEFIESKS